MSMCPFASWSCMCAFSSPVLVYKETTMTSVKVALSRCCACALFFLYMCVCVFHLQKVRQIKGQIEGPVIVVVSLERLTALLQEPVRLFIALALDASMQHPKTPRGMPPPISGSSVSVTHLSHAGKNITHLANGLVDHFIEGIKSILEACRFFGTF